MNNSIDQIILGINILILLILMVKVWLDFQRNRIVTRIERWIIWEKLSPSERDTWTKINDGR